MKNLIITAFVSGLAASLAGRLSAQTNYIGTGSGSALDIATAANWDPAMLPTSSGNPGTISTNSSVNAANGVFTYTDYHITLTGGIMTQFGSGNDPTFSGGSFTVDGGTYGPTNGTGRGFRNDASNVTTLSSGKINSGSTANGGSNIQGGSSLIINGGEFQQWGTTRSIRLTGGSSLTVNPGGTVSMDTTATAVGSLGVNQLSSGSNTLTLNGGTTTANFLSFGNNAASPRLTLVLGGTTAGTLSAVNFKPLDSSEVIGARRINWLSGTLMTMSVANADEWAAAEWDAGRLLYNGQTKTDLSDLSWSEATDSSIGVGGGYYFVYDGGTEALSLASSGSDLTPPAWTATWPLVDTVGATIFTARARINENGTAYFVVLADAAAAPSAAEVKAGTSAGGGPAIANGSISLTANTENTAAVTGLTDGTAYDVYFVAQDAAANLQASPSQVDITTLTFYEDWAEGAAFDDDENGDGVDNGLAFLLGADSPTSVVTRPTASHQSGKLVLTFSIRNSSNRGTATLSVQHSSNLGVGDPWSAGATVPTNGEGVTFSVSPGDPLDSVIAEISSSEAASGRLFGRLKALP
jgi:hypothetical protein